MVESVISLRSTMKTPMTTIASWMQATMTPGANRRSKRNAR